MEATMEHAKDQQHSQSQMVHWRIFIISAILALMALLCTAQLDAEIYQWVDENGVIHYSNKSSVNAKIVNAVFDEYPHDEVAHLIRLQTDQELIDALREEIKKEEQQASVEEQKELEKVKKDQLDLFTSECFSPSYSLQQGRSVNANFTPGYIDEGQYLDLLKLFKGLEGNWSGNASVLKCKRTEGEMYEQMENYSVKSECRMSSRGKFLLESELKSNVDRSTKSKEIYRLFLSGKILATKFDSADSDIELIKVSSDELAFATKAYRRRVSARTRTTEAVITIKKIDDASFLFEKIIYKRGRLASKSNFHLERW